MKNNDTPSWRKEKARIQKYIDKWFAPLGLGWWHVAVEWRDGAPESVGGNWDVQANCSVMWPYRKATVRFWLNATMDLKDDEIEEIVVHEFCHILVNQMREKGIVHEEAVVTSLTKAFLWTFSAGRKTLVRPPKQRKRKS